MDIFGLHGRILEDYESYIRSFVNIKDKRIQEKVEDELKKGLLWPEPLVQFNPLFKTKYEEHYGEDTFPVSFAQYTGQESYETKELIKKNPPDTLLTNYMMLELMMTRSGEKSLRDSMQSHLIYLAFDELHTYRGRQGSNDKSNLDMGFTITSSLQNEIR